MSKFGTSLAFLLLAACSGTVDTGDRERWSERIDPARTEAPQTIYEGSGLVTAYTVDDSTIYALLSGPSSSWLRLVSCPFLDCARHLNVLTEVSGFGFLNTSLVLSNGELFWGQTETPSRSGPTLLSCPTAGCPDGPRELVAHPSADYDVPYFERIDTFAVDAEHVYWWQDRSVMRCARPACQAIETVAEGLVDFRASDSMLAYEEHLYLGNSAGVARVSKDGSSGPEPVARSNSLLGGVGVNHNGIFFTTPVLVGGIWRCPIDGCVGQPEPRIRGQRWPLALQLDDENVYWAGTETIGQAFFGKGTLARCPQEGCDQAHVLASHLWFNENSTVFAMNKDYLFWSEAYPTLTSLRMVRK